MIVLLIISIKTFQFLSLVISSLRSVPYWDSSVFRGQEWAMSSSCCRPRCRSRSDFPNLAHAVHTSFLVGVELQVLPGAPAYFVEIDNIFAYQFPMAFVHDAAVHIFFTVDGGVGVGVQGSYSGTVAHIVHFADGSADIIEFVQGFRPIQQYVRVADEGRSISE